MFVCVLTALTLGAFCVRWGKQAMVPDSLHIDHVIRECLEQARKGLHTDPAKQAEESDSEGGVFAWLGLGWKLLTTTIMIVFLLSCVQQFAQMRYVASPALG